MAYQHTIKKAKQGPILDASYRAGFHPHGTTTVDCSRPVSQQERTQESFGNTLRISKDYPWSSLGIVRTNKSIEKHEDYPRFVQYIKTRMNGGEWLFDPPVWGNEWFARMAIEMEKYELR
jgi:hypothetical protein